MRGLALDSGALTAALVDACSALWCDARVANRSNVVLVLVSLLSACGGKTEVSSSPQTVAPGYCAKACLVTADCCPTADTSCPGDYPHNYACENGLCRAPYCQTDSDCKLLLGDAGAANLVCRTLGGHVGCTLSCAADADCSSIGGLSGGTCTGKADDGTRICAIPPGTTTLGCKSDADCPAGRHCQSGTCGCEEDSECKPNLDVCTTDRAFAYPASAAPGSH